MKFLAGGIAGAVVVALAAGFGIALAPGWGLDALAAQSTAVFGRPLAAGSVHLQLSPLALRFDDVTMAGAAGDAPPLATAASLLVPMRFTDLLRHHGDFSQATLVQPAINLAIDEMGHVNWPVPAKSGAGQLFIDNGTLEFKDARTGQHIALKRLAAALDRSAAGDITLDGTAIAGDALATLSAYVKDVARADDQGSPVTLSFTTPDLHADFDGQLAITGTLSLAGTLSLDGPDLRQALARTGASIPGTQGLKAFRIAGAFASSGLAFGVRGADIRLDALGARGDMSLDLRGSVPKLAASLKTSPIRLDGYLPAVSFEGPDWSATPLDLTGLRSFAADLHLETAGLAAGRLDLGGAIADARIAGGKADIRIASATLPLCAITLDGSDATPDASVEIKSVDPAGLLGALAHMDWLTGSGTLTAKLSATGTSLIEMISTLKGEAQADLADGEVQRLDIGKALAAVSRDIQTQWPAADADRTGFKSLSASFKIADGIATMKPFKMDGPTLTMTASGDIDLLRRAIDLRADPRLVGADGKQVGLPVAVVAAGPWGKPKLYPDMAGILTNPGGAYADLKGLGMPELPAGATGN